MQNHKGTFFTSNLDMMKFGQKLSAIVHKSINADRLMERIKALTKNTDFQIRGTNKRY
jgi:hypothetical protein